MALFSGCRYKHVVFVEQQQWSLQKNHLEEPAGFACTASCKCAQKFFFFKHQERDRGNLRLEWVLRRHWHSFRIFVKWPRLNLWVPFSLFHPAKSARFVVSCPPPDRFLCENIQNSWDFFRPQNDHRYLNLLLTKTGWTSPLLLVFLLLSLVRAQDTQVDLGGLFPQVLA